MNRSDFFKADEVGRRQFLINSAHTYLGVSVAPMAWCRSYELTGSEEYRSPRQDC